MTRRRARILTQLPEGGLEPHFPVLYTNARAAWPQMIFDLRPTKQAPHR